MKYFTLFIFILLLTSCTIKRGDNQYNFMQAQVKQGHITIETESGFGGRAETVGQNGPLDVWIGFIKRTFTMLPLVKCTEFYENGVIVRKECMTVPSVDVDTTAGSGVLGLSDTVATGDAANNLRTEGGEK